MKGRRSCLMVDATERKSGETGPTGCEISVTVTIPPEEGGQESGENRSKGVPCTETTANYG